MNLLWIPHTPWRKGFVGRDQHLIRHLRQFGHTVGTVSWPLRSDWKHEPILSVRKSLTREIKDVEGGAVVSVRRVPDVTHLFRTRMKCWGVNQTLFRKDVGWAVKKMGIDVVISGLSFPMTGYPPFDMKIPLVFDYLDLVDWKNHPHKPDLPYLRNADAILGVSELTYRRGEKYGASTYHLPNGADISWLKEAEGIRVRRRHNLEEATIVSLIGLSVGEGSGDYFLDAVLRAKRQMPSLHCLLVGDSPSLEAAVESRDPGGQTFTYVGKVDYDQVAEYYAASDIGLYPAPGSTHDDGRSPIKIFEYSAQGTPVVAAPIQEAKRLSFENIILAEPNAVSFAEGICKASQKGPTEVDGVDEFDWSVLAGRVESILKDVIEDKTNR